MAYVNIFTMRFLGLTFDQIAEKTGYNSAYLRRLFMEGGKLHNLYQDFREKAKEMGVQEAVDMMFGQLPDIVRAMIMTAKTPYSATGVSAGKQIMEYTLGKPPETVHVRGAVVHGTFADWMKAETLKQKEHGHIEPQRLTAGSD